MVECDGCGKKLNTGEFVEFGRRKPPYYDGLRFGTKCFNEMEERKCQNLKKKQQKSDD